MAGRLKQTYKNILKSSLFLKIGGFLIYWYAKLVFKTCRWEFRNIDILNDAWEKDGSVIAVAWHGRLALLPFLKKKKYKANALVSLHQDGMLIANFLKKLEIGVIGGSSSRNSKAAAINLKNSLKENKTIIIVPDGPIGPNMKMTLSPVYFAKISGKAVIAVMFSVKNSKIMKKSWDQMMIPPPFSKGIIAGLGPFYVPSNATDEDLKKYARDIEDKMNGALFEIDKEMEIPKVEVGKVSKKRYRKEK